jgi:hypothetical protein
MVKQTETPQEIKDIIKTIPNSISNPSKYIYIVNEKGYKEAEHRFIWRMKYGEISPGTVIHHINEDPKDNRIENLMLFPNGNTHMSFHKLQRRLI